MKANNGYEASSRGLTWGTRRKCTPTHNHSRAHWAIGFDWGAQDYFEDPVSPFPLAVCPPGWLSSEPLFQFLPDHLTLVGGGESNHHVNYNLCLTKGVLRPRIALSWSPDPDVSTASDLRQKANRKWVCGRANTRLELSLTTKNSGKSI